MKSKKLVCIGYRPGKNSNMAERVDIDIFGRKTVVNGTVSRLHKEYKMNKFSNKLNFNHKG